MGFQKKSDDSKLQDGEAARNLEQEQGASWTPEERREHLKDELQDSPVKAKIEGDKDKADFATKALELMAKTIESLEKRIVSMEKNPKKLDTSLQPLRCATCGQAMLNAVSGKGICDGTHVMTMVAPKDMSLWQFFQGVIWNGVRYGGRQLLPPAIVDGVLAQIGRWERSERELHMPGGKVYGNTDIKNAQNTFSPTGV